VAALYTRSFVSLLLAQAAFGYAFSSFFLLPKFIVTELGRGPDAIGLVMAAFGATSVFCIPIVGALVDRIGRRPFMAAGAIVMAGTALGFLRVHEVGPLLYALRALQGVAFAMTFIASATLAADLAPPARLGQALGIFGVSMLSMHAIAPAVAETLVAHGGWEGVFRTAACFAGLCAVLTVFVREPVPHPRGDEAVDSLFAVAARPRSLRIMAVIALSGAAFGIMMIYPQPFALSLGRENVRGFFIAYALAAGTVRLGFGSVADRLGRDRISVLSLAAYGLVVLSMAELRPAWLEALGAAFGLAHGLFYPAFNALAIDGAGAHERGKVMALFNGAFNAGNSAATLAVGFLAARAGYPAVFVVAALGVFGGVALLVRSPEGRGWRHGSAVAAGPAVVFPEPD
jgi:MFS family permease